MLGDVSDDARERAHSKRVVQRHGDVVLVVLVRGQTKMASGLPSDRLADLLQRVGELPPRDITRQPHAAMISSRTK